MNNKYSIIILNALPDKKIKSIGNKCLIKIYKNYHLIDYYIYLFNTIFNNPEIIIIGGFDGKRLKKYINTNLSKNNIKYVEHNIDVNTNIGTSLKYAKDLINNKNCFIINSSLIFNNSIKKNLIPNLNSSFILVNNKIKGNIGYIGDETVINCYYDLPNTIFDCLYICEQDYNKFIDICNSNIEKYYLFEIMNECIKYNIRLKPINITKKTIGSIDSIQSIKNIRDKLCIK